MYLSDNHVTIQFPSGSVVWLPLVAGGQTSGEGGSSWTEALSGAVRGVDWRDLRVGCGDPSLAGSSQGVVGRVGSEQCGCGSLPWESRSEDRVPDNTFSGSSGGSVAEDKVPNNVTQSDGQSGLRPGVRGDVQSGGDDVSRVGVAVRGKHWQRNRRRRDNRKLSRVPVDTGLKFPALESSGYFSTCSDSVKTQLKDTRAEMFIAANKLKTQQSLAAVKEVQMLSDTRVNEVDFELKRLTLEDKLAKISEKRGIVQGTAKTVISSTISSSPPTLLSGSVSPSSSISMAEERKLRQSVVDQATELKQLKEEMLRLKAGVPRKRGNVSEWTFKSPYDNFTVDGVHKSKLPGYVRDSGNSSYVDGGQDFHLSSHDY